MRQPAATILPTHRKRSSARPTSDCLSDRHLITERVWIAIVAALVLMATPAHWSLAQAEPMILPALHPALVMERALFLKRDPRSLAMAAAALGLVLFAPLCRDGGFLWMRRRNAAGIASGSSARRWSLAPRGCRLPGGSSGTRYLRGHLRRWFTFAAHARDPIAAAGQIT
jgi:hypothetical protein